MGNRYQFRGSGGPVAGQIFELEDPEILLGRDLSSDIVVSDTEVSRTHARLFLQGDGFSIQDLRSTNGTWVNGHRVHTTTPLVPGDEVILGKVSVFVYELVPEPEADTTRSQVLDEPPEDLFEATMVMPASQRAAAAQTSGAAQAESGQEVLATPGANGVDARLAVQAEAPPQPSRLFYQRYITLLEEGNLEGLAELYHPDAVLLGFKNRVEGIEGLREFFEQYFGGAGSFSLRPTDKFAESDDSLMAESRLETAQLNAVVHDVFVLVEGRATRQFSCVVDVTIKSQASDA
jgi:pSer/pThr/pTyr-binding forkhead associated (FHA) protein